MLCFILSLLGWPKNDTVKDLRARLLSVISYMGNLIAAGLSIGVPLTTHLVTVPYILHPTRWGGLPWSPPGAIKLSILTFISNMVLLIIIGTLSGTMSTKQRCRKYDVGKSMSKSIWIIIGFLVGNITLAFAPVIKAPLLSSTLWMPYAGWLSHGLIVAIFVMFFGAVGQRKLRNEVCR
jgi:hypothetical protein